MPPLSFRSILALPWLIRHLLFWLGVVAFSLLLQQIDPLYLVNKAYIRQLIMGYLPGYWIYTYPILYGWIPSLLYRDKTALFLLSLLVWIVVGPLLSRLGNGLYDWVVGPRVFGVATGQPISWEYFGGSFPGIGLFWLNMIAGLACCLKLAKNWYEKQLLHRHLTEQKLQTELALLKAQLQPQFLLGSLAQLYQLTRQKSRLAPQVVLNLSEMLSYLLYDSQAKWVPLEKEADMVRHYVALQQLCHGAHLEVSLSISGPVAGKQIAPLLLLPFLAHAFKYASAGSVEQPWVHINLRVSNDLLKCKIIHSQPEEPQGDDLPDSKDLALARQRLERLYPASHTLKILSESDTYAVILSLELEVDASPQPGTDKAISTHNA